MTTCSMCPRQIGRTATGLCGYCVNHKCKPENAERIRAKRYAAFEAHEAAIAEATGLSVAMYEHRARIESKYMPVTLPGWDMNR